MLGNIGQLGLQEDTSSGGKWKRTVGGLEEPRRSLTVRDAETRPWVGRAICTMVRLNWNLIAPQCKCLWEIYVVVTSAVLDFKDTEARV